MALTQMQIIQSLGEAMAWFEKEVGWGVPPTELRHLSGRIGELYVALITNGQMANEVNQKGYDVVSGGGERISVKTTTIMDATGQFTFNLNTLDKVDRIIILRINTEEMQIETLLDNPKEIAVKLFSSPNAYGKASIPLSKLIKKPQLRRDLAKVKSANFLTYKIDELENGSIVVTHNGENISPIKPALRELAKKINLSILNRNGNPYNTRQLGGALIKEINSKLEVSA